MDEQILGFCDVCQVVKQFGSTTERLAFEESHGHWGVAS